MDYINTKARTQYTSGRKAHYAQGAPCHTMTHKKSCPQQLQGLHFSLIWVIFMQEVGKDRLVACPSQESSLYDLGARGPSAHHHGKPSCRVEIFMVHCPMCERRLEPQRPRPLYLHSYKQTCVLSTTHLNLSSLLVIIT